MSELSVNGPVEGENVAHAVTEATDDVRRSAAIVVTYEPDGPVVYNYLRQSKARCSAAVLVCLSRVTDWTSLQEVERVLSQLGTPTPDIVVQGLLACGALVERETEAADLDETYRSAWKWDVVGGLFHFGIRDIPFTPEDEGLEWLAAHAEQDPSPELFTMAPADAERIPLPQARGKRSFWTLLRSRRSRRNFADHELGLDVLSDALAAGLAITGFVDLPGRGGKLPLKAAPSGGARNPFEAFVYARRVAGLAAGAYHYSAAERCLWRVASADAPPSDLLGAQAWTDTAAFVVFLVAHLDRTMWKYQYASGYRDVLIEAGHVAQNIVLACAANDVASVTTAALCDSRVSEALALGTLTQGAVYAIVVGGREEAEDELEILAVEQSRSRAGAGPTT